MATIVSPRTQSPAGTPRIMSPSIAETPTSSTRGSTDLNVRPTVANPPPRRNRAALRDYYNIRSKPGQTGPGPAQGQLSRTASITSTTSDVSTTPSATPVIENSHSTTSSLTAQLDGTNFEPQPYIAALLASSSLKDILKVEATLVSEIRNLDGERKALVYDNYSKLIKAVSTIGEMQRSMNVQGGGLSEVGELEGKMEGLRGVVRDLATPDEKQSKIQRDTRANKQRTKDEKRKKEIVKWVLNAPSRLRELLDGGNEKEAEQDWARVQGYLTKWDGVKGVQEVRKACEELMAALSVDQQSIKVNDGDK